MSLNDVYAKTKERMNKAIASLKSDFDSIRAGRASAKVLEKISAEYYGTPTPITQLAGISNQDARTLVIQPWDKTALNPIVKAIQASDLGINPQNDGTVIRLTFPTLTEESRKAKSKEIAKRGEEAKIAVRNIRRDSIDDVKKLKKASEITEDDQKDADEEIQDITDDFIKQIDKICEAKTKEIMEI